jgi:hypothetical protein
MLVISFIRRRPDSLSLKGQPEFHNDFGTESAAD